MADTVTGVAEIEAVSSRFVWFAIYPYPNKPQQLVRFRKRVDSFVPPENRTEVRNAFDERRAERTRRRERGRTEIRDIKRSRVRVRYDEPGSGDLDPASVEWRELLSA